MKKRVEIFFFLGFLNVTILLVDGVERWFELRTGSSMRFMIFTFPSGFNFINVLRTAFTLVDPKSVKKIDN